MSRRSRSLSRSPHEPGCQAGNREDASRPRSTGRAAPQACGRVVQIGAVNPPRAPENGRGRSRQRDRQSRERSRGVSRTVEGGLEMPPTPCTSGALVTVLTGSSGDTSLSYAPLLREDWEQGPDPRRRDTLTALSRTARIYTRTASRGLGTREPLLTFRRECAQVTVPWRAAAPCSSR